MTHYCFSTSDSDELHEQDKLRARSDDYVSFGAGVQSTTIAFLVHNREPELLRVCGGRLPWLWLFADTGDEPAEIYSHLEKMRDIIPISTVRRAGAGSLSHEILTRSSGIPTIPMYVKTSTRPGPLFRSCTKDFKVRPLDAYAKRAFRIPRRTKTYKGPVIRQWLGISTDEASRTRQSPDSWREFFYPLIEMGWSRSHCEDYLSRQVYADGTSVAVVKSACVFCPFHSSEEWGRLSDDSRRKAADFESAVHARFDSPLGFAGLNNRPFLHRSLRPIREVLADLGHDVGGWDNECGGVCGV